MLVAVVGALMLAIAWTPLKSGYFELVAKQCGKANGFDRLPWVWVPAFDARVERLLADSAAERAAVRCIYVWARPIVERSSNRSELGSGVEYLEAVRVDPHVGAQPGNLAVTFYPSQD
jgi:hypothetical protein